MFELPIVIDSVIKTECWTYLKTCILETSALGRNWLATHMNVYLDGNYNVLFGDGFSIYPLYYYEPILNIESVNILKIKPYRIVEYVKNLLRHNYYVITDCNIAKISLSSDSDFNVHELMIYGYDDEAEVFYSPLLNNSTGKPEISKISYKRFESSYEDVRNHYIINPDLRFWRSYSFFYPITKVKLKKDNSCNGNLIFKCMNKLEKEFNVEKREFTRFKDNNDVEFVWGHYSGLGCLLALESMLENTIKGEYDLKNSHTELTISLLRLYEHRINIKRTLILLDSLTNNCISQSSNVIEQYFGLIEHIQKCYLMSKKWDLSANGKLLVSILEILKVNKVNESRVLRQAFDTVHNYLNSTYTIRRRQYEKK